MSRGLYLPEEVADLDERVSRLESARLREWHIRGWFPKVLIVLASLSGLYLGLILLLVLFGVLWGVFFG